jgi:hypothetical protein
MSDMPRSGDPRSGAPAFVIQLAAGVDGDGAPLKGWVEHLDSGSESHFGSAEELLEFIRRLARPAGH